MRTCSVILACLSASCVGGFVAGWLYEGSAWLLLALALVSATNAGLAVLCWTLRERKVRPIHELLDL